MKRLCIFIYTIMLLIFQTMCSPIDGDEVGIGNYLIAFPQYDFEDQVDGYGWQIGDTVTLTINDPSNGDSVDFTDSQVAKKFEEEDFTVRFNTGDQWDLKPGQIITMSDGDITIKHVVQDFVTNVIDIETDTITGTANPGSELIVRIDAPYLHELIVTADDVGEWRADFSGIADIIQSSIGSVIQFDSVDRNNQTLIRWTFGFLHIEACLNHDNIGFINFRPLGSLTFKIYDEYGGELLVTETLETDEIGGAFFDNIDKAIDLVPGVYIYAWDELTRREAGLELRLLTIDSIDTDSETISGQADPGETVFVHVYDTISEDEFSKEVKVGSDGYWYVRFDEDLKEEMRFAANIFDEELDVTVVIRMEE